MQHHLSDYAEDDAASGFRLERVEFLNWGTFTGRVWSFEPAGHNALLTGDIGSGKSTIVDALTTLLVPPRRITYNKAAGADTRERDLRSYVLGYYKSEKAGDQLNAKPVALRRDNTMSVLLARFTNPALGESVTLAQVFWMQTHANQPRRFYLVSDSQLDITTHFRPEGGSAAALRRTLGRHPGTELFESFSKYDSAYRVKLGIRSQKAMDLFYQTVSMKSVGNLTDFVRQHMLESGDSPRRIEAVCKSFEDLNQAHVSVLKAKHQIDLLKPLIDEGARHKQESETRQGFAGCRDALASYFAERKAALLEERIRKLDGELERANDRRARAKQAVDGLREQAADLKRSITTSGGQRLEDIAQSVRRLTEQRQEAQAAYTTYAGLCDALELPTATNDERFFANRKQVEQHLAKIDTETESLEKQRADADHQWRKLQEVYNELDAEIQSLAKRTSNIPNRQLELRRSLCCALGLEDQSLPYVGEIVQVREDQADWRGAAERLLHNFGLSVLVPESLYEQVSGYVDRTHLGGRLVYYRVRSDTPTIPRQDQHDALLWYKLQIHRESPHTSWLEQELARRFDHVCCDDLASFRRHPKAVTRQGQTKTGGLRHEKDDRHHIDDPSRYILGWDNKPKIQSLEQQRDRVAAKGRGQRDQAQQLKDRLDALRSRRDAMRDLLKYQRYAQIDWPALTRQIDELETERRTIESSNNTLKTLQGQLKQTEADLKKRDTELNNLILKCADLRANLTRAEQDRDEAAANAGAEVVGDRDHLFAEIDRLRPEALTGTTLTLQNIAARERELREWLQGQIDAAQKRIESLTQKVVKRMQDYCHQYSAETREVDAAMDSLAEFGVMLDRLIEQDLPRHEHRFRKLLNEGTINDIAMFQSQLDKEYRDIEEKVDEINQSLIQIEYSPGSYIQLVREATPDQEVRAFRAQLRDCLGETLASNEDEVYTEAKFRQVKELIDRFNGREGTAEADQRWTRKVTDVRNWSVFSASERWQADGTEREHYSDSAGKSGGQKEKLAYTILASALAFQFGLKPDETLSRSFRFVMIDEAFGRGSDESARYGLEVFTRLNLQLLIVTPLQKIHVIEDFVRSVHFVHNATGEESLLRNMTITAYHEEKARVNGSVREYDASTVPHKGEDV